MRIIIDNAKLQMLVVDIIARDNGIKVFDRIFDNSVIKDRHANFDTASASTQDKFKYRPRQIRVVINRGVQLHLLPSLTAIVGVLERHQIIIGIFGNGVAQLVAEQLAGKVDQQRRVCIKNQLTIKGKLVVAVPLANIGNLSRQVRAVLILGGRSYIAKYRPVFYAVIDRQTFKVVLISTRV